MTIAEKTTLIIWVIGVIPMRYIVKKKTESQESWSDVASGYLIGVIWPVVILIIYPTIIAIAFFSNTKPPKWL
jgi:SNF family Na+-dependent transporter